MPCDATQRNAIAMKPPQQANHQRVLDLMACNCSFFYMFFVLSYKVRFWMGFSLHVNGLNSQDTDTRTNITTFHAILQIFLHISRIFIRSTYECNVKIASNLNTTGTHSLSQ